MRESRALKEGAADDYTTLTKQVSGCAPPHPHQAGNGDLGRGSCHALPGTRMAAWHQRCCKRTHAHQSAPAGVAPRPPLQVHEMRAAKEEAERELGGVVAMYDQVRGDWQKKLKDRRKEVRGRVRQQPRGTRGGRSRSRGRGMGRQGCLPPASAIPCNTHSAGPHCLPNCAAVPAVPPFCRCGSWSAARRRSRGARSSRRRWRRRRRAWSRTGQPGPGALPLLPLPPAMPCCPESAWAGPGSGAEQCLAKLQGSSWRTRPACVVAAARRPTVCRSERDAATARLSAVVPQLEALEATWARLHGICGADTAEDLIAYWQGGLAADSSPGLG